MKTLIGYTGFVGSNILNSVNFDYLFNSRNINEIKKDLDYDFVVYAGVRAEKYLANINPKKDLENIKTAIRNIQILNPHFFVLISTIDIYKSPIDVNEDTRIDTKNLHPYGLNRFFLEEWVRNNIKNHLIVRLPGLFGQNMKKNFLFDMINLVPTMIKEEKFNEITSVDKTLLDFYTKQENGFYRVVDIDESKRSYLRGYFEANAFNALCFTDSDSRFQFYNLAYLWSHIEAACEQGLDLLNIATEPVTASETYEYIFDKSFNNKLPAQPANYDIRTKHAEGFGGTNGYILDKQTVLSDIKQFVQERLAK